MKVDLTLDEFSKYHKIFRFIDSLNMGIEYKAYKGFLETVDPLEAQEFFNKGYITIDKWRLYVDLSIGTSREDRIPMMNSRLACTDGGSYGLPYFDRLIQKYLYLKHNPETIVKCGLRWSQGGGGPNGLYTEGTDAEDKIDIITYDYNTIKQARRLYLREFENKMKLTNMPDLDYAIIYLFYNQFKVYKLKDIVCLEHKDGDQSYTAHSIGHRFQTEEFGFFKHYYLDALETQVKKYKLTLTKNQKHVIATFIDLIPGLESKLTHEGLSSRHHFHKLLNYKKIKEFIKLPTYVTLIALWIIEQQAEAGTSDAMVFDIIDYYAEHPEYQADFINKKRAKNRRYRIW